MVNKPFFKKTPRLHIVIIAISAVMLLCALGLIIWNSSLVSRGSSLSTEVCLWRLDLNNPKGMSDHRDKSECYPNIISSSSLSQQQKDEYQRNSQIIHEATNTKSVSKCAEINGIYYSLYPPNMTKVITRTEQEAKKECESLVKSKVKTDSQNAERLSHYFELPNWGIKLEWKDTSDEVRYYAADLDSNGVPATYELTTKNTEEQGLCPLNKNGKLGAVTRDKDPQRVGKGNFLKTKIGNYYYYDTEPKIPCIADDSTTPSSINHARVLIRSMITGIQSQSQ